MTQESCLRGIDALLIDAERYGGSLTVEQVERVLDRRKLPPNECVEVFGRLLELGVISDPDDEPGFPENNEGPSDPVSVSSPPGSADADAHPRQRRGRSDSEISLGLATLGDHKLLSAQEERELGRAIQIAGDVRNAVESQDVNTSREARAILERGNRARTKLILMNLRLVMKSAYKYASFTAIDAKDLFQEGVIGLIKAVEKYDHTLGYRFSTYATWWIEQSITRYIADAGETIRLPVHIHEKLLKLRREMRVFIRFNERMPSVHELAEETEMEPSQVKFLLDISNRKMVELDKPILDDPRLTLADVLSSSCPTPEDEAIENDARNLIGEMLSSLTPREKTIIIKRFGLEADQDMTLQELGEQFNVTRERIRQIEAKALRKLRHPTRKDKLAELLSIDNSRGNDDHS